MSEWQPIETAPELPDEFLAYDPFVKKMDVCVIIRRGAERTIYSTQYDTDQGQDENYDFIASRATHWMPLPIPPTTSS